MHGVISVIHSIGEVLQNQMHFDKIEVNCFQILLIDVTFYP